MNLTKKQKRLAVLASVILLLIITNPSIYAFKAYIGNGGEYRQLTRPANLFIFSEYNDTGFDYIGIFGNFFELPHHYNDHQDSIELKLSPDVNLRDDSISKGLIDTTTLLPPPPPKKITGYTADGLPIFKKN